MFLHGGFFFEFLGAAFFYEVPPAFGGIGGELQASELFLGVRWKWFVLSKAFCGGMDHAHCLGDHFGLYLDGRIGVLIPSIEVQFGESVEANFGLPMLECLLGLELYL